MQALSLALLLCVTVGTTAQFCTKGSSFAQDSKTRQGSCQSLFNGGAKSPGEVKGPTPGEKGSSACCCYGSGPSGGSGGSSSQPWGGATESSETGPSSQSTPAAQSTTQEETEATSQAASSPSQASSSSSAGSTPASSTGSGSWESSGSGSGSGGNSGSGSGACTCGSSESSSSSSSEESGSGSGSHEGSSSGSHEGSSSGSHEGSASGSHEGSGSGSGGNGGSGGSGSWGGSGGSQGSGSGGCVCDGSGSGTISGMYGKEDFCILFQYFLEITVELGEEYIQEAWIELLNKMQVEIIFDVSLTAEQMAAAVYGEISVFFLLYPSCASTINNIFVTEWNGYVFDLEEIAVDVSFEISETIIELDATGNCALFEALRNASAGTSFEAQVEILIASLTVTIQSSSSFSVQCAGIYAKLIQFFATYSGSQAILCGGYIEGYGTVSIFVAVSGSYWRIQNFAVAVGGSASSCELIVELNATVYNVNAGSTSERAQLKELVEDLVTNFASLSVEARVEYFISAFYQFLIIQEWSVTITFEIELQGFGTICELIAAECFGGQTGALTTSAMKSSTMGEEETSQASQASSKASMSTTEEYETSQASQPSSKASMSTTEEYETSQASQSSSKPSVSTTEEYETSQASSKASVASTAATQSSTPHVTTVAGTTKGASTAATTAKPGNCATALQLIVKGSNSNTSLTISIQQSFSTTTWTAQQKTSFSAYFKNIINLQAQYTGQTCLNKVANVLLNWTKDAASITATKSVQIYFYASNVKTTYWGTVGQFCSCATS
ncbi:unnamed protein product [Bursaphelenchus okinawaensis]|uniref:Uncharacterized protein n=1 Tax=Bursaphelenchus okinawaensis TaxID=465554 RepID=A0A811KQZ3_9BILA|nr:unnamed protein product [Bursaphelenchus okinawaensis]CAG9112132.1 unnamed protein product [Bursaphelenchus okinawaensis]